MTCWLLGLVLMLCGTANALPHLPTQNAPAVDCDVEVISREPLLATTAEPLRHLGRIQAAGGESNCWSESKPWVLGGYAIHKKTS